jgi:hypothetical protein
MLSQSPTVAWATLFAYNDRLLPYMLGITCSQVADGSFANLSIIPTHASWIFVQTIRW